MKEEDEGKEFGFEKTLKNIRLLPVSFGSRKAVGKEKNFHSHTIESLAATWAIIKNPHFLWVGHLL